MKVESVDPYTIRALFKLSKYHAMSKVDQIYYGLKARKPHDSYVFVIITVSNVIAVLIAMKNTVRILILARNSFDPF